MIAWRQALGLLGATAAMVLTAYPQMWLGPFAPYLLGDLVQTAAALGYLTSVIHIGSLVTALPSGRMVDRLGIRRSLGLALLGQGAALFLIASATGVAAVLPLFLVLGAGFSVVQPATSKMVYLAFPPQTLGTAMAVKQMGVTLSGILAGLSVSLVALWGWRWVVSIPGGVLALAGLYCLLPLARRAPVAQRSAAPAAATAAPGTRQAILRDRGAWSLGLMGLCYGSAQQFILSFGTLYLIQAAHLEAVAAGRIFAVTMVFSTVFRVLWGMVSDWRCGGDHGKVLVWIGLGGAALIAANSAAALLPPWLVVLLFFGCGSTLIGWNGVFYAFLAKHGGTHHAGTVTGMGLLGVTVGLIGFAPLAGFILDGGYGFPLAWLLTAGVVLVGVIILQRARRQSLAAEARVAPVVHGRA